MNLKTPLESELRDLEQLLEQQPLREPTAALDRRMEQLLVRQAPAAQSRSVLARLFPAALVAAASAGAVYLVATGRVTGS